MIDKSVSFQFQVLPVKLSEINLSCCEWSEEIIFFYWAFNNLTVKKINDPAYHISHAAIYFFGTQFTIPESRILIKVKDRK